MPVDRAFAIADRDGGVIADPGLHRLELTAVFEIELDTVPRDELHELLVRQAAPDNYHRLEFGHGCAGVVRHHTLEAAVQPGLDAVQPDPISCTHNSLRSGLRVQTPA